MDLAAGRDAADNFKTLINGLGGSVGKVLFAPSGTADFGAKINQTRPGAIRRRTATMPPTTPRGKGTSREIVEFSVSDLPAHEIDRWIIRPFRRRFLENLLNGRQWDFGIPPDSWRIRFDPGFVVHEVSLPSRFLGL